MSLRAFYIRRARRLLPALGVFLLFALAVSVALHPSRAASFVGETALRFSYAANLLVAFTHNGVGSGFGHLWSLAAEEQFYLLWPVILLFLIRRGARPWLMVAGLLSLAAIVSIERTVVILGGTTDQRVWFAPDTHSDPILYGCAAAVICSCGLARIPKSAAVIGGAAAIFVLAAFNVRGQSSAVGLYPMSLIPVFGIGAALFLVGVVDHGIGARVLSCRPLMWFGTISYALYLWHPTLLTYAGRIGAVLAVGAAALSLKFVEEPFRRRSRRRQSSSARYSAVDAAAWVRVHTG